MGFLKHIAIYFLVINVVGSALTVPLIHLDYKLRRDYIARVLCINQDKPVTSCGGHCYLSKRLKKAAKKQKEEPKSNNRPIEISFFSQEIKSLAFDYDFREKDLDYPAPNSLDITIPFAGSIFRPPRLS